MGLKRFPLFLLIFTLFACSEQVNNQKNENSGKTVPLVHQTSNSSEDKNTSDNPRALDNDVSKPMEVIAPGNITQAAEGVLTQVKLIFPVVLNATGKVSVSNNAPEGGFPVGDTIVLWSVTDANNSIQQVRQNVSIYVEVVCAQEQQSFNTQAWPILSNKCLSCHSENLVSSNFNLMQSNQVDYLRLNFLEFQKFSLLQNNNGLSLLLSKAGNINKDHGGGEVLLAESNEIQILSNMIQSVRQCLNSSDSTNKLQLLSVTQQLRKTTLGLATRLPTLQELANINTASTDAQLDQLMDDIVLNLMDEASFYARLKEIFNDLLLTDAYKSGSGALNLNLNDYDNKGYFATAALQENGYSKSDSDQIRHYANFGLSQAPLELIAYIVKNNRPFTEILSADYLMVNPYSATLFSTNPIGVPDFGFVYGDNPQDHNPENFKPVKVVDNKLRPIPHAGILTTLPFFNRYPSSNTNLNRKRARIVFKYFLNTDVEGLADRTALDLNNIVSDIPTLYDPQCKVCHDVIDPIAGLFKNWGNTGRFRGDNQSWLHKKSPSEMLAPGYSMAASDVLPAAQSATALQWLGRRIGEDNRFTVAMVNTVFEGFTGIAKLDDPGFLQSLKDVFILSNYNLKTLISTVVRSDYFLVDTASQNVADLNDLNKGTAHLLTPEQLDRKISAIFSDYQWYSPGGRNLLDQSSYRLLYGGIDSRDVTSRTTSPTSIMSEVQIRIASQLACNVVPKDFTLSANQRNLFPMVEINDDASTQLSINRVKNNIRFLYEKLLGQKLSLTDPEVTRIYDLFVAAVARITSLNIPAECRGSLSVLNTIAVDQKHTVRAWMAVVNYMVRDYQFLYE